MTQQRFFGTYNGELVEYRHPSNGDTRYVILESGDNVQRTKVTPSPYPWQFHTREFWDAYPGMRWAAWDDFGAWKICKNKPSFAKGGYCMSDFNEENEWSYFDKDALQSWRGEKEASLFENPFFRHYPAELDDPKTWEQWPTAICGAWDDGGRFYCYTNIPKAMTYFWIGEGVDEDESAFNGKFTGDWRESLIMRPSAKKVPPYKVLINGRLVSFDHVPAMEEVKQKTQYPKEARRVKVKTVIIRSIYVPPGKKEDCAVWFEKSESENTVTRQNIWYLMKKFNVLDYNELAGEKVNVSRDAQGKLTLYI